MSYMKGILLNFILCLYLATCRCQSHGISTREAKSFYETRPNSYLMTNEFTPLYFKDSFKNEKTGTEKRREMENNQISWIPGHTPVKSTEGKKLQLGDTDKIITVRVSSSVAWKPNFVEKPKLSALGYNVEVPKMSTGFGYQHYSPQPIWEQQTTEAPKSRYYETRIEAVSSRRGVVFGKPKISTTTTPPYDYFPEPREEFCEVPETNYELQEKNYEVDESVSLMTNGNMDIDRTFPEEKGKLGYVMEGRNFRKYRIEERTADGFIVGEFGFIRNEDGKLQGVRYTADVNANPRLIYDALVKFLSL